MSAPPPSPANAPACPPTPTTTHDVPATADHVSPTRRLALRPTFDADDGDFAAFVTRNRTAIRDHVDATLRGTPDSDVDRDAVIQEALIRVWRDLPNWPTSDARRQALPAPRTAPGHPRRATRRLRPRRPPSARASHRLRRPRAPRHRIAASRRPQPDPGAAGDRRD